MWETNTHTDTGVEVVRRASIGTVRARRARHVNVRFRSSLRRCCLCVGTKTLIVRRAPAASTRCKCETSRRMLIIMRGSARFDAALNLAIHRQSFFFLYVPQIRNSGTAPTESRRFRCLEATSKRRSKRLQRRRWQPVATTSTTVAE